QAAWHEDSLKQKPPPKSRKTQNKNAAAKGQMALSRRHFSPTPFLTGPAKNQTLVTRLNIPHSKNFLLSCGNTTRLMQY
ncbi:MAG: hypothetical protein ABR976_08045, partial [Terracidiphilus sp.]